MLLELLVQNITCWISVQLCGNDFKPGDINLASNCGLSTYLDEFLPTLLDSSWCSKNCMRGNDLLTSFTKIVMNIFFVNCETTLSMAVKRILNL